MQILIQRMDVSSTIVVDEKIKHGSLFSTPARCAALREFWQTLSLFLLCKQTPRHVLSRWTFLSGKQIAMKILNCAEKHLCGVTVHSRKPDSLRAVLNSNKLFVNNTNWVHCIMTHFKLKPFYQSLPSCRDISSYGKLKFCDKLNSDVLIFKAVVDLTYIRQRS